MNMTNDLRARLEEDQRIIAAATGGTWVTEHVRGVDGFIADELEIISYLTEDDWTSVAMGFAEPDATFIAASRTRWEQANRALLAVLERHRPVFAVFNWRDGSRYEEPCEDCHGAKGEHPCGCWSTDEPDYRCYACETAVETKYSARARWPCPTIQAIRGLTYSHIKEGL